MKNTIHSTQTMPHRVALTKPKNNKRKKTVARKVKKHPTIITYVGGDTMYICTPETEQNVIDNYITKDCLSDFIRYESETPGICEYTFTQRVFVRNAVLPPTVTFQAHEQNINHMNAMRRLKNMKPKEAFAVAVRAGIYDKNGNLTEKYR